MFRILVYLHIFSVYWHLPGIPVAECVLFACFARIFNATFLDFAPDEPSHVLRHILRIQYSAIEKVHVWNWTFSIRRCSPPQSTGWIVFVSHKKEDLNITMIATLLTRSSAKPVLSFLRSAAATTRGFSHFTVSGNILSGTCKNEQKHQSQTFSTISQVPVNVDNEALAFNPNSATQSIVHQRGTVTKTLKALDMAVVRQIKAELLSVDQNNDGRQVFMKHHQYSQQESSISLSYTPFSTSRPTHLISVF